MDRPSEQKKALEMQESAELARKTETAFPLPSTRIGGWFWKSILVLAIVLIYLPVWQAGFVWDDHQYITDNPCMTGLRGLKKIWTTSAADISPLTFTTFWVEHAVWGVAPLPYHLINVVLHGVCAVVLWRVLRILQVPGAWLGAAAWAFHPVQVESVAWVSETKNPQSGLFFLLSILFFLKRITARGLVRQAGRDWSYELTLIFTALAMASKSSTVVLPAVMCLCAWWMNGRWSWRDVIGVLPIFSLSLAASALSIWTQGLTLSKTHDPQWVRTYPERLAAAGEAIWFYLGKLVWPHPLMSNYPRWKIDAGSPLSYLPLLAALVLLFVLWRKRHTWSRPWFFAYAYFLTALLPILGLFDNPIFRFSLVFDHFQYLASMGPLALMGTGLVRLTRLTLPSKAWWQYAPGVGALLVLGSLSWQRSEVYQDEITFWTDAISKNPQSWLGHDALGGALLLHGKLDEAEAQYEEALAIHPDSALANNNLGTLFLYRGRIEQAAVHLEKAVANDPYYAEAWGNLGNVYLAKGQVDAAVIQYKKALAFQPDNYAVYFSLGNASYAQGRFLEAIANYEETVKSKPDYAEAHNNLGNAFLAAEKIPEAIAHYEEAIRLNPGYAEAHNDLGVAFFRMAQFDEAIIQFRTALQITPNRPDIQSNLTAAQKSSQRSRSPDEHGADQR